MYELDELEEEELLEDELVSELEVVVSELDVDSDVVEVGAESLLVLELVLVDDGAATCCGPMGLHAERLRPSATAANGAAMRARTVRVDVIEMPSCVWPLRCLGDPRLHHYDGREGWLVPSVATNF